MKKRPASGKSVRVLKAPREAKHLQGQVGTLIYTHQLPCVSIDGKYTHFNWPDLEVFKK